MTYLRDTRRSDYSSCRCAYIDMYILYVLCLGLGMGEGSQGEPHGTRRCRKSRDLAGRSPQRHAAASRLRRLRGLGNPKILKP